jgi:two-component SAPR family response regulator
MKGQEFAKKIKGIKSEGKMTLMSAFEINDIEFSSVLADVKVDAFLQKPFSIRKSRHNSGKSMDFVLSHEMVVIDLLSLPCK